MANVSVYNIEGKEVGTIDLNDAVFGVEVNEHLVHMAVVSQLANKRQGTQKAKTRSEVSGGGRKPWRQKGTGRARQGSTRAPQWTKGGIALGPKPRSYRVSVNKKEKRIAMLGALSSKVSSGDLIVLDNIALEEYKTKKIVAMLGALGANGKPMIVTEAPDQKVIKSAANIPGVATAPVNAMSVYEILKHDKLILTKAAVASLEEVYGE